MLSEIAVGRSLFFPAVILHIGFATRFKSGKQIAELIVNHEIPDVAFRARKYPSGTDEP